MSVRKLTRGRDGSTRAVRRARASTSDAASSDQYRCQSLAAATRPLPAKGRDSTYARRSMPSAFQRSTPSMKGGWTRESSVGSVPHAAARASGEPYRVVSHCRNSATSASAYRYSGGNHHSIPGTYHAIVCWGSARARNSARASRSRSCASRNTGDRVDGIPLGWPPVPRVISPASATRSRSHGGAQKGLHSRISASTKPPSRATESCRSRASNSNRPSSGSITAHGARAIIMATPESATRSVPTSTKG